MFQRERPQQLSRNPLPRYFSSPTATVDAQTIWQEIMANFYCRLPNPQSVSIKENHCCYTTTDCRLHRDSNEGKEQTRACSLLCIYVIFIIREGSAQLASRCNHRKLISRFTCFEKRFEMSICLLFSVWCPVAIILAFSKIMLGKVAHIDLTFEMLFDGSNRLSRRRDDFQLVARWDRLINIIYVTEISSCDTFFFFFFMSSELV